jgi:hypothetical protein
MWDFRFTLQRGGTAIVDEFLNVMDVKVDGHLTVVLNSIGEELIH